MAQGYLCDNEDGNPGAVLVTNLINGDTAAFCAGCWPSIARAMADAMDGGAAPADLMDDTVTDPQVAEVVADGSPPPGRVPNRRATHAAPAVGPVEVEDATAPTSVD